MCGIYGIIYHSTKRSSDVVDTSAQLFSLLALGSAERGTDATGVARIDSDGYTVQYKNCRPSTEVVTYKRWWRVLKNITPATVAVLGHTRFGTHGDNIVANAHPFEFEGELGRLVGTHNGVIMNHEKLGPIPPLDNDSANLFYGLSTLAQSSWGNFLRSVSGSFALVFSRDNHVYMTRNIGSPCYMSTVPELEATVYASTYNILKSALDSMGLKYGPIRSLEEGVLFDYEPFNDTPTQEVYEVYEVHKPYKGWAKTANSRAYQEWWSKVPNTKEEIAEEWGLEPDHTVMCDRCGLEEMWRWTTVLDNGALLCTNCTEKGVGSKLVNDSLQCGVCRVFCPVDSLSKNDLESGFVCSECELEREEALRNLGRGVECCSCGKHFDDEDVENQIVWLDSMQGFVCSHCCNDPEYGLITS